MRISDWSSDVCSSDLRRCAFHGRERAAYAVTQDQAACAARRLRGAAGGAVPAMTASVEGPMTAATINPDEAAHFGRLAADWWNPSGESAMLHRLNPVRLAYVRERIDSHFGASRRDRHPLARSEEHTSELQSLMRISYAVFCFKKTTQP